MRRPPAYTHIFSPSPHPRPQVFLDYLRTISGELHVVSGDFDEFAAPEQLVRGGGGSGRVYHAVAAVAVCRWFWR